MEVHEATGCSFSGTMLGYCSIITLLELVVAEIISRTKYISKRGVWTVASELISALLILLSIGISAYLAGFIIEPFATRWNITTFFDSFFRSVLVGIIPVVLPSLLNIRYAFAQEIFQSDENKWKNVEGGLPDELITIKSMAKKEHLSFYPDEFIYAESKGNYVIFHLLKQGTALHTTIRSSITEIENQFETIPFFMRTHRAFIVNLKKITSRSGNALGYRLTISGCDEIIPVSRKKAREFEQMMK
jgi:hypothetical protein